MADANAFLEKRGNSRLAVKIPVQFRLVEDRKELDGLKGHTALAKDISLDGLYINSPKSVNIGDIFRLDISVPEKSKHLFAFAEVVWVNPKGAGLKLLLMPNEDKDDLKAYLKKLEAE
jgi:hypothetical protein